MSVTVELSAAIDDVPLSGMFDEAPNARVAFEPLIQVNGSRKSSVRVYDSDQADITETLEADPAVHRARVLDVGTDRSLIEIEWSSEGSENAFSEALIAHNVAIVEQVGTDHGWEFTLRFPDRQSPAAFQRACHEADVPITIHRVSELTDAETGVLTEELTPAQREVVMAALDGGYFEIPRRTTLVELSEEFGISDQAVSERLRRAQAKLARRAGAGESHGRV